VAFVRGDVADPAVADGLVAEAIGRFGRLDIVVNNAGVGSFGAITEPASLFDEAMRVNVAGHFHLTRAAWPIFAAQAYGRLVMTTSNAAMYGIAGMAHYAASKGAIFGMMGALALEGAPLGIKVNAIAPGAMTDMARSAMDMSAPDPWFDAVTPEHVAPVVALLAHEACPVNGELIGAAGGRVTRLFLGDPPGFHDDALTPESLLGNWPQVMREEGYAVPRDAIDDGGGWARRNASY
jgi:NAD(P)-dependent dehydrogenase (short-subunit alcohol dehydrogenase family)